MSEEVIRPSDGSLLFDDPDGIYVFSADECVVTTPPATYVTKPLDNDEKLSGPDGCSANGFRLAPNGSFLFRCKDASWMTESGQTMAESNGLPLSFDGQRVLTGTGVFDIAEQALYPFNGFPLTNVILGQRVQAGGFWIVTSVGDGTTKSQLWLVDATGNLQLVGNYPDPPADPGFSAVWTSLAGDGTLVQLGKPAQGSARPNLIVRRTLSGEFAVAYDESTNPLIRASYPSLVTGP